MGFFGALFLAITGGAKVAGAIKDASDTKESRKQATKNGNMIYTDSRGTLRLTSTNEAVYGFTLRNGDRVLKAVLFAEPISYLAVSPPAFKKFSV